MKCCTAQVASIWEDPEKTLKKVRPLINSAAQSDADLICLPEQFATGWDPSSQTHIEDLSGTIVSTLRELAQEYSLAIIGSFRQRAIPFPHNTTLAISSDGSILTTYAKIHLFTPAHEDQSYTPGTDLGFFSLKGVRCGLAICYDLRFPSLFRIYAKKRAQIVFVPAAWPEKRIHHWELFISARAAENQMYVLGCNTIGITPVDSYSGASMTADPHGSIISCAGDRETLIYTDINPEVVDRTRREFSLENDQKDDLYQSLLKKHR